MTRKRTTLNLDVALVAEAASALGTTRVVDTVHAALDEVVRRHRRLEILDFRPALDLKDLDAIRASRPG